MGRTMYVSDLHFSHANGIKYDNRPWDTIEEMNAELIKRWNRTVHADDTVYILGDIKFGKRDPEDVRAILHQLKGKKVLVRGNHDPKNLTSMGADDPDGLIKVCEMENINDRGRRVIMCHYPLFAWDASVRGSYMLHGHVHATTAEALELEDYLQEQYNAGKFKKLFNVGCMFEYMDYAPKTLDEIEAGVLKMREEKKRSSS